jgi:hypothetical protein
MSTMTRWDAWSAGCQHSVSTAALCQLSSAKASCRPFHADQTPKKNACHSRTRFRSVYGVCRHHAVAGRQYNTCPAQCSSMTARTHAASLSAVKQQGDTSDVRMPRRHAMLTAAAAFAAVASLHAAQPAVAKPTGGDWTSPGLATVEDDAAPK